MTKRLCALILVFVMVFALCGCYLFKDASIDANWEFVTLTFEGEVTNKRDIDDPNDAPKFYVVDDNTCVFSLLGKEHTGILEEEDGIYYVTFTDGDTVGERALQITIKHDVMTIEFLPIDCRVIMKAE